MNYAQYSQTTATAANNFSSQPHVVTPPISCLVIVLPMLLGLAITGYQQYRATVLRWRIELAVARSRSLFRLTVEKLERLWCLNSQEKTP